MRGCGALLVVACLMTVSASSLAPSLAAPPPKAAPGGMLMVGDPGTPGTSDPVPAEFTDASSGSTYRVLLLAQEHPDEAGVGVVTAELGGPSLSLCSVHGPGAFVDFSTGGPEYGGNNPLGEIQCGTAFGMSVAIDDCVADISLHGFGHADHPFAPYLGPTTIDLHVERDRSGVFSIDVVTHGPKGPTTVGGAFGGAILIDTCA